MKILLDTNVILDIFLNLLWSDFEDAVQYSIAFYGKMDAIITRNSGDYKQSDILIYSPQELLEILKPYL